MAVRLYANLFNIPKYSWNVCNVSAYHSFVGCDIASASNNNWSNGMFKYIHQTWTVGREFDFPVSFIIREIMRGLFTHVNVITEI